MDSCSQDLIPSLPHDVALHCFLRFSLHTSLHTLRSVCRQWKLLLHDPRFYLHRKAHNLTHASLCLIHPQQPHPHSTLTTYTASAYDPSTHTSHALPPIPDLPRGLPLFCQCLAVKDSLLLLGGWNPITWESMTSLHIFHFPSGRWRQGHAMPSVRSFFACGVVADGLVIVAGGHDDDKNALRTAEVYNVELDEWEALPEMSEERDECRGAVAAGGRFYVAGGYATAAQGRFVRSADVLSPRTWRWERVEEFWPPAGLPVFVVALMGRLVSCDGERLMEYDCGRNAWEVVGVLPEGLRSGVCGCVVREKVFVCGSNQDGQPAAFLYEPRLKEWSPLTGLPPVIRTASAIEI